MSPTPPPEPGRSDLSSALLARVPPHDADAEVALLGSLLLDADKVESVRALVRPDDFYVTAHRRLYEVILSVYDAKGVADALLVREALERGGILEEVGGHEFLAALARISPTAANAEHYAGIVRDRNVSRGLIRAGTAMVEKGYEGEPPTHAIEAAREGLDAIERHDDSRCAPVGSLIEQAFADLDAPAELATAVPTGLVDLDRLLGGFKPQQLGIVAGRPSMGKTSLLLQIALHVATVLKRPVAFFSLEMSKAELVVKAVSMLSGIDSRLFEPGKLTGLDRSEAERIARDVLGPAPLFIDDSSGLTPAEIRAGARRLIRRHGVEEVFVDHLGRVGAPEHVERAGDTARVGYIARELKNAAKALAVPFVVACQLNRLLESRPDKRPLLSDLRQSGEIEQEADKVLLLHRPVYFSKLEKDRGLAQVEVAKSRMGATGTVQLAFLDSCTRFGNLSKAVAP